MQRARHASRLVPDVVAVPDLTGFPRQKAREVELTPTTAAGSSRSMVRYLSLSLLILAEVGCREVRVEDGGSGGAPSFSSSITAQLDATASVSTSNASTGGALPLGDILDPNEVYLLGTLDKHTCEKNVLGHWSAPNEAIAGFDCQLDPSKASIRPTDGRLLYANAGEGSVHEFHCDACPLTAGYPTAPLDNDTLVSTSPCGSPFIDFLVSPTGKVLHHCDADESPWYDEAGQPVYSDRSDSLRHLGFDDLALTWAGNIVDLATSTTTASTGLPPFNFVMAVRALTNGSFALVTLPNDDPRRADERDLWQIDRHGVVTLIGAFSALPDELAAIDHQGQLDGAGAFLETVERVGTFEDVIVRRTLGGTTEIVYDEANGPLVKLQGRLVTGP